MQPLIPGTRTVAIVSNPFETDRDVWFVGMHGLPFPVQVPRNIHEDILSADFASGLGEDYANGVVIDGVVNMGGFNVFDLIPLMLFENQLRTDPYNERAKALIGLGFGAAVQHVPALLAHDKDSLADCIGKLRRRGFGRVVLKRLQDPYPYFAEQCATESWLLADQHTKL